MKKLITATVFVSVVASQAFANIGPMRPMHVGETPKSVTGAMIVSSGPAISGSLLGEALLLVGVTAVYFSDMHRKDWAPLDVTVKGAEKVADDFAASIDSLGALSKQTAKGLSEMSQDTREGVQRLISPQHRMMIRALAGDAQVYLASGDVSSELQAFVDYSRDHMGLASDNLLDDVSKSLIAADAFASE